VRAVCLGLDGAGKSVLLARACHVAHGVSPDAFDANAIGPTTGFAVRTLKLSRAIKLQIWDLGGSAQVRPYWNKYLERTWALIYVLDASDEPRLGEAGTALRNVLEREQSVRHAPLLLFVNRRALLDKGGATPQLSAQQASEKLELARVCAQRPFHVQECCALDGTGVEEGFKWMSEELARML